MEVTRKIIATSGGFAIEPRNKRLDKYILSQSNSKNPKICFIGTASGDSQNFIKRFYNFFKKENCRPSHLQLFKGNVEDIESYILNQDIIYVGGGNTKNMLAIWRDWGIDETLKKAYEKGVLMTGISAGSLCWFEQGLTDSIPGKYTSLDCLGFLKGSNCPFFNEEKKKTYIELMKSKKIKTGIASEIGVAIHYEDEKIKRVVSSRKNAKAYEYVFSGKKLMEKAIFPEYLNLKNR